MISANPTLTEPCDISRAIILDKLGFVKATMRNVLFDEVTSHGTCDVIVEGFESRTQGQKRPTSYKHWKGTTISNSSQYDSRLDEWKADKNSPFVLEVRNFWSAYFCDDHLILKCRMLCMDFTALQRKDIAQLLSTL